MHKILMSLFIVVGLQSLQVVADEQSEIDKELYENLKTSLQLLAPGKEPDKISRSPVPGLIEVVIGPRVLYFSEDGQFLINGHIIDIKNQTDVTEPRLADARKGVIDNLDEKEMIVFSSREPKHTITVFTDVDCGYCRKLHSQMDEYNKLGISVRYLLYPRTRIGSPSYKKSVSVWCSKDREKALTDAKGGVNIESKECPNPVNNNIQLGRMMGVNGTPSIVRGNGEMIPGYVQPERLIKVLEDAGS